MIIKIKNAKNTVDVWVGQEIQPNEYFDIPENMEERWQQDSKVLSDIGSGALIINDGSKDILNIADAFAWFLNDIATEVKSVGETIVDWVTMKQFLANNIGSYINYIEFEAEAYYYIWASFRSQKAYIPKLLKNTPEALDFETNYKSRSNIQEAPEVRIRTCRYGRRQHSRYVSFTTSSQDNYDNTDSLDQDFGDVTYTMLDINRNITTNNAEAKETLIDWMPNYSYEVRGGTVFIPQVLTGDLDLWELHVVGAPDIPKAYGGSIDFLSNPRMKWSRGGKIEEDCSLDPAEAPYVPGIPANKIRFVVKHPVGEQVEFQMYLKIFK